MASALGRRSLWLAVALGLVCGDWGTLGHAQAPPPATVPPHPTAHAKPAPMPAVLDLKTRLDIREPFNLGRGKVRILAFLSPTCVHCIANCQALQTQVLDKNPGADIVVHAVWLPMLSTDKRAAIAGAATILHDPRVHHYWDPQCVLNAQLLDAIQFDVMVRLYDIFLLYDRDTVWDKRVPRPGYWMHEYRGAPGPPWDAAKFGEQLGKALDGKPLDTPQP